MKEQPITMPSRNSTNSGHHIPSEPNKTHHHQPKDDDDDDQNESRSPSLKTRDQPDINIQTKSQSTSSRTHQNNEDETALQDPSPTPTPVDVMTKEAITFEALPEVTGRERLKRHRVEVAGRVWIPDLWGQEELLKEWSDCTAFDASLVPSGIMSARAALIEESRRANSGGLRIENRC